MLFSGQGKLFMAARDSQGAPGPFRFVGNVPTLSVELSTEQSDKRESTSGQRLLLKRLLTSKDANVSLTLDEFTARNLALGLYGTDATIVPGSVTDEEFPDALVAGDFVRLDQQQVSTVVISDQNPTVLTEGTNYRIESAEHGSIEILDPTTFTQPFTADYDYDGGVNVTMFTVPPPVRFMRFEGLNTAEDNSPVLVELYNVQLSPIANLGLINEEFGELAITGAALFDSVRADDSDFGPFGRIILL